MLAAEPAVGVHDVRVDDAGQLSDHRLVAGMLSVAMPQRRATQTEFRPIKNLDVAQFEQLLWQSSLFTSPASTVDHFAEQIESEVVATLDKLAPLRSRRRRPPKPSLSLGGCHRKPSTPNAYAVSSSGSGSAAAVRVTTCLTVARADVQINLLTFLGSNTSAINWHLQRTV